MMPLGGLADDQEDPDAEFILVPRHCSAPGCRLPEGHSIRHMTSDDPDDLVRTSWLVAQQRLLIEAEHLQDETARRWTLFTEDELREMCRTIKPYMGTVLGPIARQIEAELERRRPADA